MKPGTIAAGTNIEPPAMTATHRTQIETSHDLITEGLIATIEQGNITKMEEITTFFMAKLQKVLGVKFISAATRKIETCDHSSILLRNATGRQSSPLTDNTGTTFGFFCMCERTAYELMKE